MRIAVTVNGSPQYVASLPGAGFLSAHLNLADRPKEQRQTGKLRVEGVDTGSETKNLRLSWPEFKLAAGDVVELAVLDEGAGDPPAVQRSSSEAPNNLFSDVALAKEALDLFAEFEKRLFALRDKVKSGEPEHEYRKFLLAFGYVLADLGEHLVFPIYRRHAELIPEAMRGQLL